MPTASLRALNLRNDLDQFGDNKILLFALQIAFRIDDIFGLATSCLIDQSNDKKCDLVYIDEEQGKAVIAQGYMSQIHRTEAKANKAAFLNTAVSWLLSGNIDSLPVNIQSAALELRQAITDGIITTVEIWYCHNCPESMNVQRELDQVRVTTESLIKRYFPDSSVEFVVAHEVGRETLEEWYKGLSIPILVNDTIDFVITDGFEEPSTLWSAYVCSIYGTKLKQLYRDYKRELFSANVRGYLGSRSSERNINYNIKETAGAEPDKFWAYNNGLTILVHDYKPIEENSVRMLRTNGIAIVNGAQTTGAIGSLEESGIGSNLKVLARFVKCSNKNIVDEIIKYNNTQNKIEASDFRSRDQIQERLRHEFEAIPEALYLGARRGGDVDIIQRPGNIIPTDTAAQALVAFHQDPSLAYNNKGQIWVSDANYSKYYNESISARHLLFTYTLLKAIEKKKLDLSAVSEDQRSGEQVEKFAYLRGRGALILLCSAVSCSIEVILGKAIPDKTLLKFKNNISPNAGCNLWEPIVDVSLSFVSSLAPSLKVALKQQSIVRANLDEFRRMLDATKKYNQPQFQAFAQQVAP